MIDTDDLDRTLRAAFATADDATVDDNPAPRVARRVTRRRRRRVAARVGTVLAVAILATATIGGVMTASRNNPTHFGPPPTAPIPSALLRPQTPADREVLTTFSQVDGARPSSVRLLETSLGVRLYGAIDRAGLPCVMIVIGNRGETSAASGCLSRKPKAEQLHADVERFERQGAFNVVSQSGEAEVHRNAAGFLVPDDVKLLVIDHRHYPVTRNSVLLATNIGTVVREVRSGSTLFVVTT